MHGILGDDEDGRGKLVAEQPELHGAGLCEALGLIGFAHNDADGRGGGEERVAIALVLSPLRDEGREAVVKGRLVDRHLVGHFCKSLSQQSNCYDGGIECVQTATNAGEEVEVEVVEVAVAGDGDGDGDGALRGSRVRVALDFVFARRANPQ